MGDSICFSITPQCLPDVTLATVDSELNSLSPGPGQIDRFAGVVPSVLVTHRRDHEHAALSANGHGADAKV